MNITCEICGSTQINFFRQRRVDGVWVIVARCENQHKPEKRRPFYPVSQFDVMSLPVIGQTEIPQMELFTKPEKREAPANLLEYVEQKRNSTFLFPPTKRQL